MNDHDEREHEYEPELDDCDDTRIWGRDAALLDSGEGRDTFARISTALCAKGTLTDDEMRELAGLEQFYKG